MDKAEALALAELRLAELRRISWRELRNRFLDSPETIQTSGDSGAVYQLETLAFWDAPGEPEGDLRVVVSIDDGGWRARTPLSVSFTLAPDGSFVGE